MNKIESNIIKMLNRNQLANFPRLIQVGKFMDMPGLVMEKLGPTLEYYLKKKKRFSFKTTMQIGIQLISLLEQFHSIGCVYNDLKLDNICVGGSGRNDPKCNLKLIDFGLVTSYVKLESIYKEPAILDHHIDQTLQDFQGNFAFCSPNSLNSFSTSRRDDIYSILYIILYLFTNKIPFFDDKLPRLL